MTVCLRRCLPPWSSILNTGQYWVLLSFSWFWGRWWRSYSSARRTRFRIWCWRWSKWAAVWIREWKCSRAPFRGTTGTYLDKDCSSVNWFPPPVCLKRVFLLAETYICIQVFFQVFSLSQLYFQKELCQIISWPIHRIGIFTLFLITVVFTVFLLE